MNETEGQPREQQVVCDCGKKHMELDRFCSPECRARFAAPMRFRVARPTRQMRRWDTEGNAS